MINLTKQLTNEHQILIDKLNQVKNLGRITPNAKEILFSCKQMLLAHLKKEDEHLYPVLKKAGQKDINIKKMTGEFVSEMDGISKTAINFFDKYESGSQGLEFAADLGNLMATLRSRIQKEEIVLYKTFDEI